MQATRSETSGDLRHSAAAVLLYEFGP
jgi:hypothetical protein